MYLPNPTTALREQIQSNPTRKQWLIGGGIALGVGLVGVLAWKRFGTPAAEPGGPEGTGAPTPEPWLPNWRKVQICRAFGMRWDVAQGKCVPLAPPVAIPGQYQPLPPVPAPVPSVSDNDRQAAIVEICGAPSTLSPRAAATILRRWALPAWRTVTQGDIAPSATLAAAGKAAIRTAVHDLCALPVAGLNEAIGEIVNATLAIESGSRYAPAIVATGAKGRLCSGMPLDTRQSLALLVDVALTDLRHGADTSTVLLGLMTCQPAAADQANVFALASALTTGARQIRDESL